MYGLNDPVFESIRAAILAALIIYLVVYGRHSRFASHSGARLIVLGFGLLFLAAIFDVTDEIPGLERYILIGATPAEVYLETIGYLTGFLCLFAGFVRLLPAVARLEKVERSLRDSEARFRQVFELCPDPLIIARADQGAIIEVNRAFVSQTGIAPQEAIGKNSAELSLWAEPEQRDEFLGRLRRDGAVFNLESRFRMKDGEVRVGLTSAQLLDLNGYPAILIAIRDITPQKLAELALQETDRMKSEFISTAAHELRTPLATILGYVELLRTPDAFGGFSEVQRAEFLDEVYEKGETLSRIIDDMLDISRIESGQAISFDLQRYAPWLLLGKVVRRFELQTDRHVFQVEYPGAQPAELCFDMHRMTQVLENLLSNAVKYSPRGGTILVRGETAGAEYVITVADQGIGMTREQQARIFDKFYRADSSNTAIGGLGLGMSIARQIVESHGGRIWVESAPGEGTKVSFSLALAC